MAAPVRQFQIMQDPQKLLIEFGLQLLGKMAKKLADPRLEQAGLLQRPPVLHHLGKGSIELVQGVVNLGLLRGGHGALHFAFPKPASSAEHAGHTS